MRFFIYKCVISLMILFYAISLKCQSADSLRGVSDWANYKTYVNDKPSLISIDLNLSKIAPLESQKYMAWISVKMNESLSEEQITENEKLFLEDINKALISNISSNFNSTFAGHQTFNGFREFYFYVNDTLGLRMVISETMNFFSNYSYKTGMEKDVLWAGYFDYLYPGEENLLKIRNRKIVKALENKGDLLLLKRPVDHWIYFKTETDRDSFWSKIKKDKFLIINKEYTSGKEKLPFMLHISRIDKVDFESIDELVIPLWRIAKQFKGNYDGWETNVEK